MMAWKHFPVAVLLVATVLVAGASAQEKNEVAILIGRTFISNQGVIGANSSIHFGNGLTFEGSYGRRVLGDDGSFASLTLEVPVVINPDEDLNFATNAIPGSYGSFFITPSARGNLFPGAAVSPWVSFGGGFGHFNESSDLVFFGPNTGKTGTTTGVYQIGVGLDVRIHGRFSLRGEARDFNSGVPQLNVDTGKSRQHNYFVGGGVVWHF
jgi:hypothetical protein